jgi:hypothetical protein
VEKVDPAIAEEAAMDRAEATEAAQGNE